MNRFLTTTFCVGTLFLGGVAVAQDQAQSATTPTETVKVENAEKPKQEAENNNLRDPNKVICKKSGKTSTRLRRKKICKTRAKWDEERSNNRDALNEVKSRTSVGQHQ
jgi:predicted phosphoribosyltransferase